MALITESYLRKKAQDISGFRMDENIRNFSVTALANEKRAAAANQTYDIFLSHSLEDAILVKALRDELASFGFSVYVDWIEDTILDRKYVTKSTAAVLRERMCHCHSLLYATSQASRSSVWMPWELGYMDAHTKRRVAVAPIVQDSQEDRGFEGQEYLGLYPYLDKTNAKLYIHKAAGEWVGFREWLAGAEPARYGS